MPPQVEEFLPQQQQQQQNQQPQSDVEQRVNELSSTVDELRRQVSDLQTEMRKMTQLAEQSQPNQRVTELSSTVEELRRKLSDMQSEMQQQTARHEKESSLQKEMWKRMASQQRQQQSSGRVPDWLRQKILQERRSEVIRRELNKYNSTPSSATPAASWTSSESNAENQKKTPHLVSHVVPDMTKNQQKPSSSSAQSHGGERLQQDCPPKESNPWALWISPSVPVTNNTSEKSQAEKQKTDRASNNLYEENPYLQSMMAGLEKNKQAIRQASENPEVKKFLSMTEDEQRQFNLNLDKAMDASIAFLDGMKIWNDSLKSASEKNRTEENLNK